VKHREFSEKGDEEHQGLVHLEFLKLVWLVVELCMFFGLLFVAQVAWSDVLTFGWRYGQLLYWFGVVIMQSILSIGASIVLKWVLIG